MTAVLTVHTYIHTLTHTYSLVYVYILYTIVDAPRVSNGTPPHPEKFFGRPYGGRVGTVRTKTRLDNATKTGCCILKGWWTTTLPDKYGYQKNIQGTSKNIGNCNHI